MAKTVTELRAFVASPMDVREERAALEDVIRELNTSWLGTLGLRLELVRWETHASPQMGADPQQIINEQIGHDYDLFIGILGNTFGSATPRAGSGTEEEFNNAYARLKDEPGRLRVMFYFKDAPINMTALHGLKILSADNR